MVLISDVEKFQSLILQFLLKNPESSAGEIRKAIKYDDMSNFPKLIKPLVQDGSVVSHGKGKGTKYIIGNTSKLTSIDTSKDQDTSKDTSIDEYTSKSRDTSKDTSNEPDTSINTSKQEYDPRATEAYGKLGIDVETDIEMENAIREAFPEMEFDGAYSSEDMIYQIKGFFSGLQEQNEKLQRDVSRLSKANVSQAEELARLKHSGNGLIDLTKIKEWALEICEKYEPVNAMARRITYIKDPKLRKEMHVGWGLFDSTIQLVNLYQELQEGE